MRPASIQLRSAQGARSAAVECSAVALGADSGKLAVMSGHGAHPIDRPCLPAILPSDGRNMAFSALTQVRAKCLPAQVSARRCKRRVITSTPRLKGGLTSPFRGREVSSGSWLLRYVRESDTASFPVNVARLDQFAQKRT